MYVSIYRNYSYSSEGLMDSWNNLGKGGRDNPYGRAQARHNIDYNAARVREQQMLSDLEDWYQLELSKFRVGKSKFRTRTILDNEYDIRKAEIKSMLKIEYAKADAKRDVDIARNSDWTDKAKYYGGKGLQLGATLGAAILSDRLLAKNNGDSSLLGTVVSTGIATHGISNMNSRF